MYLLLCQATSPYLRKTPNLHGPHKGLLDHPIGRVNCSNPVSSLLPSGLPLIPLEQSELPGQCSARLQPSRFARCLPGLRCTPSSFKFIHWYLLMTAWVVGYSKQQCDRLFCIAAVLSPLPTLWDSFLDFPRCCHPMQLMRIFGLFVLTVKSVPR